MGGVGGMEGSSKKWGRKTKHLQTCTNVVIEEGGKRVRVEEGGEG